MKKNIVIILTLIILIMPTATLASNFNPNFILSDSEISNYNSMNMSQIKNFLINNGSRLKNYVDKTVKMYAYQLIYDSSRIYRINPKYILTLLQKEQSLITDTKPSQSQFDWATGYGCPDSGGCNPKYKGLANQIDWGTGSTRYYIDHPEEFKYQVGKTYTIDNKKVTIANNATRALYIYTPHIHGNKLLHSLWSTWFSLEYPNGSLLQNTVDGGIWLIENGLRRPFLTKSAFASRYSFDKVVPVNQSDIEKYEIGKPIQHANYSLLKTPNGKIFLLDDNKLRHIDSIDAFRLFRFFVS